jgi:hypothetical protein
LCNHHLQCGSLSLFVSCLLFLMVPSPTGRRPMGIVHHSLFLNKLEHFVFCFLKWLDTLKHRFLHLCFLESFSRYLSHQKREQAGLMVNTVIIVEIVFVRLVSMILFLWFVYVVPVMYLNIYFVSR